MKSWLQASKEKINNVITWQAKRKTVKYEATYINDICNTWIQVQLANKMRIKDINKKRKMEINDKN